MPSRDDLPRHLGLLDSVSIFVGVILGSGIFVAPSAVAAATGSFAGTVALWTGCAAVVTCGALCYAECGARLPRTGGFYVFYREVFGDAVAFVGGYAALLVTYPASIAAIAFVFARYLGEMLPGAAPPVALAALGIVTSAVANALGVRTGARSQVVLSTVKVVPLLLLSIAALAALAIGATAPASEPAGGVAPAGLASLFTAILVVLWTYDGWSDLTLVAGEVRDPRRNLPRTAILGIGALAILYVLVQAAVSLLLPRAQAMASKSVVADAVAAGLGMGAGKAVSVLVVVATFGAIHGVVLTASRLGYAMANDGMFLRGFGVLDPRLGTPARSIAALAGASLAYLFLLDFEGLLSYFSFSVWIFYGLAAIAVLRLRRRDGAGERPSLLGAVAPFVVLLAAVLVTGSVARSSGARALVGGAVLLSGFPVYAVWRRFQGKRQA